MLEKSANKKNKRIGKNWKRNKITQVISQGIIVIAYNFKKRNRVHNMC